jgi:PPK2 family polyphosphate:nucleotide phosphotransferase
MAGKTGIDLAAWQHAGAGARAGRGTRLLRMDPAARPYCSGDKQRDKAAIDALAAEIDTLQELFWADKRFRLLLVLQGMDTSGKDGTIRGVFGKASALGVHAVGWKAPTPDERAHDFLWRIHQKTPGDGEIVIFNRSHYEDVLVPVVNGWIDKKTTLQRYRQINEFERMLAENRTVTLKFLLLISKDEQRARLQERLDDPNKHWKFAAGDLEVRKQWSAYQRAYADLVGATGTAVAPWTIVPADSKTHRNLMIATVVRDTLKSLKLRYPPGDPSLATIRIE